MDPIPFRVRLGVTGHRKLTDIDALTEKINEVLQSGILFLFDEKSKLEIERPDSTKIAFSLLTPLAEGADRLVAKAVRDHDKNSIIEVVLPLTLSDYRETFDVPGDPEFDQLYEGAEKKTILRKHNLANDPDILQGNQDIPLETRIEESRKDAFVEVGKYVVNRCDVLIALWDGKNAQGRGGTAEVVQYAMDKKRPVIIISTITPHNITTEKGFGL